jgi:hypothetical protein
MGQPLQWFICLLHFNELPYKHLFQNLHDEITGLTCFFEKIGKQLVYCEKLLIANFETTDYEDINITKTDLS